MDLTVRETLVHATNLLKEITDTPELDARILLEKASGLSHVQIIIKSEEILSSDIVIKYNQLIKRRVEREPIAHIIGEKEFYSRLFKVTKDTLIPRADTETLVDVTINYINTLSFKPTVLDLCTGTGCIGITIKAETSAAVTLADISKKALEVAAFNSKTLLNNETELIETNLLEKCKIYDIIVTNPPYLTKQWCDETSEEVKREPILALEGFGNDGLDLIRDIAKEAKHHLSGNHSALFIECDYRQTTEVKNILIANNFEEVKIYKDLAGKERVVGGILCTNK